MCGTIIKQSDIYHIVHIIKEEKGNRKKLQKYHGQNAYKCVKNYKPTDPRSLRNPK